MAKVLTDSIHYTSIADAIRAKGISGSFMPEQMASAIERIEGSAEITDSIAVTERDAQGHVLAVDFYGTIVPWYQFGCSRGELATNFFAAYLERINFMDDITELCVGAFMNCGKNAENHIDLILPETCTKTGDTAFYNCGFSSVTAYFTNLSSNRQMFSGAHLRSVFLPKCTGYQSNSSYGNFRSATELQTVVLGGIGYGVNSIGQPFRECTQTDLTITAYCHGDYTDACISGIRNGATNATIIIKASEDTEYRGTNYFAGSTIVTSTV